MTIFSPVTGKMFLFAMGTMYQKRAKYTTHANSNSRRIVIRGGGGGGG
jgi:hypothetical protein